MARRGKAALAATAPPAVVTITEVEDRLLRAMKTLRAMPDKEQRFHRYNNGWPEYVHKAIDAYNSVEEVGYRFKPKPFDVSDCIIALNWTRGLENREWNLIWWRSFDLSFKQIADRIGRSDEMARRRYRDAIQGAWYNAFRAGTEPKK
jgi:hypothetical protein